MPQFTYYNQSQVHIYLFRHDLINMYIYLFYTVTSATAVVKGADVAATATAPRVPLL
jgi:hypothetical protein